MTTPARFFYLAPMESSAVPTTLPCSEPDAVARMRASVVKIGAGKGLGSGVCVAPGLVLTARHVVASSPSALSVLAPDGSECAGQVVQEDEAHDQALVRCDALQVPAAPMASGAPRDGQGVLVVGHPFGGHGGPPGYTTSGIVSAVADDGRVFTDAAINVGNSGGAMFNETGELLAIVSARVTVTPDEPAGGGQTGLGFGYSVASALPMLDAMRVLPAVAAVPVTLAILPCADVAPPPVEAKAMMSPEEMSAAIEALTAEMAALKSMIKPPEGEGEMPPAPPMAAPAPAPAATVAPLPASISGVSAEKVAEMIVADYEPDFQPLLKLQVIQCLDAGDAPLDVAAAAREKWGKVLAHPPDAKPAAPAPTLPAAVPAKPAAPKLLTVASPVAPPAQLGTVPTPAKAPRDEVKARLDFLAARQAG